MLSFLAFVQLFLSLLVPFDALRAEKHRGALLFNEIARPSVYIWKLSVRQAPPQSSSGTLRIEGPLAARSVTVSSPRQDPLRTTVDARHGPNFELTSVSIEAPAELRLAATPWREGIAKPYRVADGDYVRHGTITLRKRVFTLLGRFDVRGQEATKMPILVVTASYSTAGYLESLRAQIRDVAESKPIYTFVARRQPSTGTVQ